jgi:UPF0042 nucleotide-binding protein
VHDLRDTVHERIEPHAPGRLSLTFESFGFKHGIPGDADFVFDARSLPNPYWEPTLRKLTGRDPEVVEFLEAQEDAGRLIDDIERFIAARIPEYERNNRGYLTVAIGCTGGQHRSVFIAERLAQRFAAHFPNVNTRHSGLAMRVAQDSTGSAHSAAS